MILLDVQKSTISKSKLLGKILGGVWKYTGGPFGLCRQWTCEDGRVVRYTSGGYADEWESVLNPPKCWLYTPNKPTKPFYWS